MATSQIKDDDELLTDTDVSNITKVPTTTLRAWRARGKGPRFIRLGDRTVRHRRADIEAWLAERCNLAAGR